MTILPLLLILITFGCVSTPVEGPAPGLSTSATTDEPPMEKGVAEKSVSLPEAAPESIQSKTAIPSDFESYTTGMSGLRLDLSAVLQGIYYRLTGSDSQSLGPVRFAAEVGILSDGTGILFENFALNRVSVRMDQAASNEPLHRRVEAVLMLVDALGRQAFVAVAADYLIGDEHLLVRQAVVIPHHPHISDIRFLVVPSGRLPSLRSLKRFPLDELFRIASENALDRDELARLQADETGRYKLLAFNMVRGRAEDRLMIFVSEKEAAGRAAGSDRISLNDSGWTAAVVDGSFQLNSMPAYTFHVGMQRSGTVTSVGRFKSVIK